MVGIIHTNYLVYTRSHTGGIIKEPLLYYVNQGALSDPHLRAHLPLM